jgi:hypothetical protein
MTLAMNKCYELGEEQGVSLYALVTDGRSRASFDHHNRKLTVILLPRHPGEGFFETVAMNAVPPAGKSPVQG